MECRISNNNNNNNNNKHKRRENRLNAIKNISLLPKWISEEMSFMHAFEKFLNFNFTSYEEEISAIIF